MSMVLPGVVGFKLSGKLCDGVTATDLVLTVTQILRKHSVVGKFVEFYGKSLLRNALGVPFASLHINISFFIIYRSRHEPAILS